MELSDVLQIVWIVCAAGIIFVLPSTIYTAMFWGIFYRRRPLYLDTDDLKGTSYEVYGDALKSRVIAAKQIACRQVTVTSEDGLTLAGRYYDKKSPTTLLLVHGFQSNGFNNFFTLLPYFLDAGYNVLMIDQRAHGDSGGHFTTAGCKEQYDLMRWIAWLEGNTDSTDIFLYGISMGAATIGLASDKIKSPKVKGLIMEAGFTSFLEELRFSAGNVFMKKAAFNYVTLCAKHLLKADIKGSTTVSLSKTALPVLFFHGNADKDVPMAHTEASFGACASDKYYTVVEGAPHALCHFIGKEAVEHALEAFITKYQTQ